MSAAMMVSATVSLVFMYVPKLYAIYFVQEIDVHAGTYRESRSMDETVTERTTHFGGNFKLPKLRGAAVAPAYPKPNNVDDTVEKGVHCHASVGAENNVDQDTLSHKS